MQNWKHTNATNTNHNIYTNKVLFPHNKRSYCSPQKFATISLSKSQVETSKSKIFSISNPPVLYMIPLIGIYSADIKHFLVRHLALWLDIELDLMVRSQFCSSWENKCDLKIYIYIYILMDSQKYKWLWLYSFVNGSKFDIK